MISLVIRCAILAACAVTVLLAIFVPGYVGLDYSVELQRVLGALVGSVVGIACVRPAVGYFGAAPLLAELIVDRWQGLTRETLVFTGGLAASYVLTFLIGRSSNEPERDAGRVLLTAFFAILVHMFAEAIKRNAPKSAEKNAKPAEKNS